MSAPLLSDLDVILLDCYALLFRAFFAFPIGLTSPDGRLTNAVFGFTKLTLNIVKEVRPKYLAATADMGKPTFRHTAYVDYKANRPEAPNELKQQIASMWEILKVLNIPTFGIEGFEADDLLGTLATEFNEHHPDLKVGIVSGDRDLFQLVGKNIYIVMPEKKNRGWEVVDREGVVDRLGVQPEQVPDYKALCGDTADNIPGVRGIGPKTACKLITTFGSVERLYAALALHNPQYAALVEEQLSLSPQDSTELAAAAEKLTPKVVSQLVESHNEAWLSKKLATIDTHVPLTFSLEDSRLQTYDKEAARTEFENFGFRSLIKDLPNDQFEDAVQESLF